MNRHARHLPATLCVVLILVVTLWPVAVPLEQATQAPTVWGERATADAAANLLLFLPLGMALAAVGWAAGAVALAGALLSGAIELAQTMIPGRFPNALDVIANAAGAWLGAVVVTRRAGLMRALRERRPWPAVAHGALLYGLLAATAVMLRVELPASTWYGQWTPRLGHMTWYEGRVRAAAIGGHPVPSRRIERREPIRRALERGDSVVVEMTAGPPPPGVAPIFSIFDDRQREILLIGADGTDLVLRIRRQAADARLDAPSTRIPGALDVRSGEPLVLTVRRHDRAWCASTDTESRCVRDAGLSDAWTLLLETETFPNGAKRAVGAFVLALLAWPLGFLARTRVAAAAQGLVLLAMLALLPRLTGTGDTPLEAIATGLLAVALGATARRAWLAHADREEGARGAPAGAGRPPVAPD